MRIDPEASTLPDSLLFDALCLSRTALEVFDAITDSGEVPRTMFAGVWLLRQAVAVIEAAQTHRARAIAAGAKPMPEGAA